jgi:hypothetical protein
VAEDQGADNSGKGRKDKSKRKIAGVDVERGESVILVARPAISAVWYRYLITLGIYGFWRSHDVSIVTDRRVLVGKGIVSRKETSLPYARINDASYVRKGLYAYCEVAATHRGRGYVERIGPLSSRQARRFTAEVLARS